MWYSNLIPRIIIQLSAQLMLKGAAGQVYYVRVCRHRLPCNTYKHSWASQMTDDRWQGHHWLFFSKVSTLQRDLLAPIADPHFNTLVNKLANNFHFCLLFFEALVFSHQQTIPAFDFGWGWWWYIFHGLMQNSKITTKGKQTPIINYVCTL